MVMKREVKCFSTRLSFESNSSDISRCMFVKSCPRSFLQMEKNKGEIFFDWTDSLKLD